jgi:hypothetical protein
VKLQIENDYQQKIMSQAFEGPATVASEADVQTWRTAWMDGLKSWHSPYKLMVDCTNLTVADDEAAKKALDRMVKFFKGFFLRDVVGFGKKAGQGHEFLPFEVKESEDEAAAAVGIRVRTARAATDFRSTIQLQNHFRQHVIELNFSEPVKLTTKDQIATIRSKLTNILMQWHSKWSLLVDCTNLEVDAAVKADLERMLTVMKGFFMKQVIGYSPKGPKDQYPFEVYRARHKAAAVLEGEGNFSGDDADCKSRKA